MARAFRAAKQRSRPIATAVPRSVRAWMSRYDEPSTRRVGARRRTAGRRAKRTDSPCSTRRAERDLDRRVSPDRACDPPGGPARSATSRGRWRAAATRHAVRSDLDHTAQPRPRPRAPDAQIAGERVIGEQLPAPRPRARGPAGPDSARPHSARRPTRVRREPDEPPSGMASSRTRRTPRRAAGRARSRPWTAGLREGRTDRCR